MDQDRDPAETREWLDALDSVEAFEGIGRVDELLDGIVQAARRKGAKLPFAANTAYVNTISPDYEAVHPGDRAIEHKIRSLIRWAVPKDVLEKSILPLIPVNRLGEPERNRPRRGVPRRRRSRLHHRLDAIDQWRAIHGVMGRQLKQSLLSR